MDKIVKWCSLAAAGVGREVTITAYQVEADRPVVVRVELTIGTPGDYRGDRIGPPALTFPGKGATLDAAFEDALEAVRLAFVGALG